LGIWAVPPYYHNGACETLACVVGNLKHRTANSALPDRLSSAANQARVVAFLQSLDDQTVFPTNLSVRAHDIFFDPPTVFTGATVVVGANVSLFGTKADFDAVSNTLKVKFTGPGLNSEVPLSDFAQNFGQATVTTTWTAPGAFGLARITVQVDSTNVFSEANELDNTASRLIIVRTPPPDTTPPQVLSTAISDDDPFDANDPIASTTAVKIRIVATDPSSPPTTSGLRSFCIVRYYYDTVLRRWVESTCSFQPLPAPDVSSGGIFTYTVNAVLPSFEGAAYAFVWVKDAAGNISRTPGFDVISFIPAGDINIRRNDVRLFRITLTPGQQITFTLPIVFGDVDASVFDNVTPNATRIAVSANNGTLTETVTFANTFGSNRTFQLEVRAVVNSRFRIAQQTTAASSAFAIKPDAIAKDMPPGTPLVAGPPALQTAIGDPETIYLPLVLK
jgi:hypothetical protein